MKKSKKLLAVLIAVVLAAPMGGTVRAYAAENSVSISDSMLRNSILEEINKDDTDQLTKEELQSIKKLDLSDKGIKSLAGLEECTNLEELEVSYNDIKDLTPIKSLKKLKDFRALDCGINDISALAALSNLEYLDLDYNNVSDITPLLNLKKLDSVSLDEQIINLAEVEASGSVKVKYPVSDGIKNGDIRIYDISDNGVYKENKKQVEWKNIKADTEVNFFFKEHISINGNDIGKISGIVNVPVKVK